MAGEQRTTPEMREDLRRLLERTGRGLHLWRYEAYALLDDADALAGALAEVERLRTAIRMALHGPSDGEIGMETARGRLVRQERILSAALGVQSGPAPGSAPDAPRIAQDAPHGANSPKAAPAKIGGATGAPGAKTDNHLTPDCVPEIR